MSAIPPREGLPTSAASDLFGVSIGMKFNDAREALLKRLPGKPPQKVCNSFGGCDVPVLKDAFNLPIYTNYETAATKLYVQDPCPKSGCPTNLRLTSDIAGMEYRSGIEPMVLCLMEVRNLSVFSSLLLRQVTSFFTCSTSRPIRMISSRALRIGLLVCERNSAPIQSSLILQT
jgi:hypothetical protein